MIKRITKKFCEQTSLQVKQQQSQLQNALKQSNSIIIVLIDDTNLYGFIKLLRCKEPLIFDFKYVMSQDQIWFGPVATRGVGLFCDRGFDFASCSGTDHVAS